MNRQEKLIAEIHAEFDTAQDRLLSQANEVLNKPIDTNQTAIESVGERLTKVGFTNTPTVKKANEIKERKGHEIKKVVETREQAKLIQYYQSTYPFLKFLTEAELDRICKKYNLVYAPSDRYIEEVPEKNLRDIETAQALQIADAAKSRIYTKIEYHKKPSGWGSAFLVGNEAEKLGLPEIIEDKEFATWIEVDSYLSLNFKVPHKYLCDTAKVIREQRDGLFIAAHESHFNTKGLNKKGLGFFQIFETEIKDPIVFRYVRGGIQVLTKWGLEANDPDLVVPKLN